MSIVNTLLRFVVDILDTVLPAFGLSDEFLTKLDSAIVVIVDLIQGAGYFLPLDIFVICFSTMLLVDNFALLIRIAQWTIKTIRG